MMPEPPPSRSLDRDAARLPPPPRRFDLLVVVLSVALLVSEIALQSETKASSTAVVLARASRAGKAVVISLRWARAVRAMRLLSKVRARSIRGTGGWRRGTLAPLRGAVSVSARARGAPA
eukprot:1357300-Prymnesium_polylepis.2